MAHEQVVAILNEMSPDDRTALARGTAERGGAATDQAAHAGRTARSRRRFSVIRKDSVGRLMTPDFIAVHDDWTVKEVLDHIREHGQDRETLNVIYVVDDRGKLIDDLRIREFLLRPLESQSDDFMDRNFRGV